jgi:membrane associated rhomboid family serine protease
MIPLRDTNPRRIVPVVNVVLIIVNVLMFFWEVSLGSRLMEVMQQIAFVPARFWATGGLGTDIMSMFTSMFLHGGWMHLAGNMLYLFIFGDNLEDRLGHFRYLVFYLLCGIVATLAHAFAAPGSVLPAVGASGAIAGVLGGYLILFPRARVMTLIPLFMFVTVRELPALVVLGLWFVLQLFTGAATLGIPSGEESGGVAYFAHIGGFIAGLGLVYLMGGKRQAPELDTFPRFDQPR